MIPKIQAQLILSISRSFDLRRELPNRPKSYYRVPTSPGHESRLVAAEFADSNLGNVVPVRPIGCSAPERPMTGQSCGFGR